MELSKMSKEIKKNSDKMVLFNYELYYDRL